MKLCPRCSTKSLNSAAFCECGYSFSDESSTPSQLEKEHSSSSFVSFYVQSDPNSLAGPYTIEEIQKKVRAGVFGFSALVQRDGEQEWQTVGTLLASHGAPQQSLTYSKTPLSTLADRSDFDVGAIARDVAIIWILTLVSGFLSSVAMHELSNALFLIIGFCISGYSAKGNRWKHLSFVAVFTWLTSIVNVFFGFPLALWLAGVIMIFPLMGVGGVLSYLFRKT